MSEYEYFYIVHLFSAGLPYALNQAGLPLGLLLLIAVAFITGRCI